MIPIPETTDERRSPPGAVTGSARAGVSPSCQDLTNPSEFPPAVTLSPFCRFPRRDTVTSFRLRSRSLDFRSFCCGRSPRRAATARGAACNPISTRVTSGAALVSGFRREMRNERDLLCFSAWKNPLSRLPTARQQRNPSFVVPCEDKSYSLMRHY